MLIRVACALNEKKLLAELERRLSQMDVQLKIAREEKRPWDEMIRSCADIFIFSRKLIPKPVESNLSILNELPEKPVIILLNDRESPEENANLLATGADVVLYAGISFDSICEAIESTIESRRVFYYTDRFDQRGRFQPRLNDFISNSREMQVFLDETLQVVSSDATLLILGETGTGKEHLAKAIHAESQRSSGPFVPINMAAIPDQLMESELFGHEQGAFTGAVRSRRGAFELAHQGTLFLDEIGEMPLLMQSKLLRVLQDFEFTPVGSEKSVWVNVRIIAATNKDLGEEVEKGNFRRDLYYRIGVVTLTLPPLRKRKEDIPAMANHFLNVYNKKLGQEINRFSQSAMKALSSYSWPGNIRELMNVIERAVLLCRSESISIENLPTALHYNGVRGGPAMALIQDYVESWETKTLAEVTQEVLDQVEKRYLEMVLTRTRGKIGETAEIAGIHPRGLYGKMKKLGIDKARFKR